MTCGTAKIRPNAAVRADCDSLRRTRAVWVAAPRSVRIRIKFNAATSTGAVRGHDAGQTDHQVTVEARPQGSFQLTCKGGFADPTYRPTNFLEWASRMRDTSIEQDLSEQKIRLVGAERTANRDHQEGAE